MSASFQISMSSIQLQLSSMYGAVQWVYNALGQNHWHRASGRSFSHSMSLSSGWTFSRCSEAGLKLDWESRKCEVPSSLMRSLCATRDYAEHHPTPIIGSLVRASCLKQDRKSYQWKATARVCHNHPDDSSLSLIIPSWVPHDSLWILHDFR